MVKMQSRRTVTSVGARIMPSADQVPVKSTHSMMLWPKWVVLIAGSDRFCIKCCSSSQPLRHAGAPAGSRSRRESGRLPIAFVPDHHGPGHPGEFVGKRYGSDPGGSPCQQSSEPGPMPGAVDFGIADHCKRASREEAAQIAIALLADIAKLVLTPARVLLRHEPNPGREIPSRSEGSWLSNAGDQCCGQRRTDARDRIQPLAGRV